ncbi:MAG: DEAD/DEAH box helicase [Clostridium sp.]
MPCTRKNEPDMDAKDSAASSTQAVVELTAIYSQTGFTVDLLPISGKKQQDQDQITWYKLFCEQKYKTLFHMGFMVRPSNMSPSVAYLHRIADLLVRRICASPDIELVRDEVEVVFETEDMERLKEEVPFSHGSEFVGEEWLLNLWNHLLLEFREEIKQYTGTVAAYFVEFNPSISVAGRVFFHLVESGEDEYPFAFMATYSSKPSKSKKAIHTPLKNALLEFKSDQKKLLSLMSTVAKAADKSDLISNLMESGEMFYPLRFTTEEAYRFLTEIPLYEEAGIMCRVPDWWRKHTNSIKLTISMGDKKPSAVGLDAIMDFRPMLTVDGETLTEEQLREFSNMAEGLIQYKGKWIEINKKKLEAALAAFEKVKDIADGDGLSIADAMRMELNRSEGLRTAEQEVDFSVTNGIWLRELREKLLSPKKLDSVDLEATVHATLRDYQMDGYKWLNTMEQLGFGACLADDMGLGKTVQIIAYLEHHRITKGGHALLLLPASLMGNWQKELEKFAPDLTFQILHKSGVKAGENLHIDDNLFLCITTYGMVSRQEELTLRKWDLLILDEAQAIKNAGTKQSRAVKAIPASMRIAMTGTPIENRLSDLWSLFDFLNKGLLGTPKEFAELVKQMQDDEMGYARLRKMVNPFILRRLKTDRLIISDLPDKIEIREYASMSKKQITLYKKLVDEIAEKLKNTEGIERKGLVLASIMKFKQICNHPDQYLNQEEFKKENSGKFEQLEQICETIYEKRERVIVFTQFREMTEPLSDFLTGIFHKKGFVLHGGTPVKKRNEMVEAFNGEAYVPYMVLSLKAGGVGLNLTSANHVIHFDRWWNPAVENQATDRAFRIGQTKNVMVYKFVTRGTIEEKIDTMIEDKQKLAGDILSSAGEQWITELDNTELLNLLKLGGDGA